MIVSLIFIESFITFTAFKHICKLRPVKSAFYRCFGENVQVFVQM